MTRIIILSSALALVGAACGGAGPTPSEAAFSSAAAACRSLAFDQGYEVVEMGEAQSAPGGIAMSMQLRKDGRAETRRCLFEDGPDTASFP